MTCIPPQIPLLYRKNGICRGIPNFHIFDPKHCGYSLECLGEAVLTCMYVLRENIKKSKLSNEIFNFNAEKNLCMLHGQVFVMTVTHSKSRPPHEI